MSNWKLDQDAHKIQYFTTGVEGDDNDDVAALRTVLKEMRKWLKDQETFPIYVNVTYDPEFSWTAAVTYL